MVLRKNRRRQRVFGGVRWQASLTVAGLFATNPSSAQVLIPYGNSDNDFEKYLVAAISLVLLGFAIWRYFRNRR